MNIHILRKFFAIVVFLSPLILILTVIISLDNLLGQGFINVSDSALLINNIEISKKYLTFWTENNLGYKNGLYIGINFFSFLYSFIFLSINQSVKWLELTLYFVSYVFIFYSSCYAFYLLQKKIFYQNRNIYLPFITAFFYTFNVFNIPLIGLIDQYFILQTLYPYLLLLIIELFEERVKIKYILALGLILGFTIDVPIFSFAVYICLFIPYLLLKKNILKIKILLLLLASIFIALLLAGPLIYALFHGYSTPDPFAKPSLNLTSYIFPPYGIMGTFQFYFHWAVTSLNTYSNLYLKSGYGLFSTYMIWASILTVLVIHWNSINNKRVLLFLIFSLVIAIFLSKGAQKPFDEINTWIYNSNPIFAIFRTPGSKFGVAVMLILSTLILYVLNINKYKLFLIIIVMSIVMQTWIFFNPKNFTRETTAWWNEPIVNISQDYRDLISFINEDKKIGSALFYPGLSGGHYDLKNGVKFSFQDVLGKYIERPIIYPETALQFSLAKKNIEVLLQAFDPILAGRLSIRYIIIREDYDVRRLNEKATVTRAQQIISAKDYKKSFTSKLFTVYEVSDKYFKDLITIRDPDKEYTLNYKKIAPYHYLIKAKIKDILGKQIIFRNNFHPDWVILDLKKKELRATQTLVDNFANGWLISPFNAKNPPSPNQNVELDIYFYPQKIFFGLSVVSIISIICFGSLTIYLFLKKR